MPKTLQNITKPRLWAKTPKYTFVKFVEWIIPNPLAEGSKIIITRLVRNYLWVHHLRSVDLSWKNESGVIERCTEQWVGWFERIFCWLWAVPKNSDTWIRRYWLTDKWFVISYVCISPLFTSVAISGSEANQLACLVLAEVVGWMPRGGRLGISSPSTCISWHHIKYKETSRHTYITHITIWSVSSKRSITMRRIGVSPRDGGRSRIYVNFQVPHTCSWKEGKPARNDSFAWVEASELERICADYGDSMFSANWKHHWEL